VAISCHGSYYVNLASKEKKKVDDSRGRILQAARRIQQAGGHSVVYHSAFIEDRDPADVTALVIEQTKLVEAELKAKDIRVWLRPELTGKPVQHGSLEELIKVCNAVETALPCIDWAHQHARFGGGWNSYDEWCELLDKLARGIRNKNVLQRMHMHVSGIEYGPKGEKKHLPLVTSDLRYKELMQALKQAGVCGTLVVEAPRESLMEDVDRFREAWEKA
jgi:deoxyribonuclease-4